MNTPAKLLKRDLFGCIYATKHKGQACILRNWAQAPWWTRPIGAYLGRREARALRAMAHLDGFPHLMAQTNHILVRSYLGGTPMHEARPHCVDFFRSAAKRLRQLHLARVTHNDLAKEPNWLVAPDETAGIIDFQLARYHKKRNWWFRLQAREDIRHRLKHKRTYRPDLLTQREHRILANPACTSLIWRRTVKPVYWFVTRKLLRWSDREGASDRGRPK